MWVSKGRGRREGNLPRGCGCSRGERHSAEKRKRRLTLPTGARRNFPHGTAETADGHMIDDHFEKYFKFIRVNSHEELFL